MRFFTTIDNLKKTLIVILVILLHSGQPQTIYSSEYPLSPELVMKLANEILCSVSHGYVDRIGTQRVFLYSNDVAAYDWIERKNTPFGKYKSWGYDKAVDRVFQPMPQYALDKPYTILSEGFRRIHYYGPDEVGRLLSEHGFSYTDGAGNDVVESLMICKKYGIGRLFFGAMAPEPLPYLTQEMSRYKKTYRQQVVDQIDWIKRVTDAFGVQIIGTQGYPWFYYTWRDDDDPLDIFLEALKDDYEGVNREFREETGFEIPLYEELNTPVKRAQRIRLWQWVLRKFADLARVRGEVMRSEIGDIELFSNAHAMVPVNYERWAEVFDHPGIDPRPMLVDNELAWKYYVGYCTRLFADLIDKQIMIAPRANVVAAGARFIPTYNTVKYWHSQAIQNGAGYLLHWIHDFSGSSVQGQVYEGPCMGNPDPSTLPKERWQAIIDCASKLSRSKVFQPPKGDTGILVSTMTNMLDGWKNVFSTYLELTKAGIWTNFISDQELWEGTETLDDFKVVFIPVMEFTRKDVMQQILEYVRKGGMVITCDPNICAYDEQGRSFSDFRRKLFGIHNVELMDTDSKSIRTVNDIRIVCYGKQYRLDVGENVTVTARYRNGESAVTEHRYGKGKAVYAGFDLFDIYLHVDTIRQQEDMGRYAWYAEITEEAGCRDLSWIWDVTVDNVDQITGAFPRPEPVIDESIQFRNYMYSAGDRRITPYLKINW